MTEAEIRFAAAELELRRERVLASLRNRSGLAYAAVGETEAGGPYLVTWQGEYIGDIWTTSPSPLHDWYAKPITAVDGHGPYKTGRAAAASLLN